MRVLWGACSQPGSLFPAIPIVKELMGRGHEVTALCDPPSEETFRALGCEFLPERRVEAVPPPARPLTRETKAEWFRSYCVALCADMEDALSGRPFNVVLVDPLEMGLNFAAEAAGIPYCSYVHWGLDECGPDVPFGFHLWDHETPVDAAFATWWNDLRAEVGLPPEPRPASEHRWYRTSPLLTLLLGLPDLVHPHGMLPAGVVRVGPTVWDPPPTSPLPEWMPTLGSDRPAVLASVSTIGASEDTVVLKHLAYSAEALDLDLIVTVPIEHNLPPLGDHVRLTSFLPHGSVLDRVSAFVNHAGNGSVNRAAYAGTPVLLMPTGRDQFQVARGATAAGFAITLEPDERDLARIQDALSQLLNDPTFSVAARRLAKQTVLYGAPSTSADLIESLAPV